MGEQRSNLIGERDEVLVEKAQRGDSEAFEGLVRRYADRLYASIARFMANPQDAEEATQEAFLRAWRSVGRFKGQSEFFTWLYRIGINEAKRLAGRQASKPTTSLEDELEEPHQPWAQAPEARADQTDLRERLREAIMTLPFEYRAPLVLKDVEGYSTQEGAEMMELSVPAFKSRLHRARVAVRDWIKDDLEEEVES